MSGNQKRDKNNKGNKGQNGFGQKKGPGRGWGGRYLPGRSRGKSGGALVISRAFAAVAANRKRALSALGGEEPTGRSRRKSGGALVISCAFAAVAANPKIRFCERAVLSDSSEERGAIYHGKMECQPENEKPFLSKKYGIFAKKWGLGGGAGKKEKHFLGKAGQM